MKVELFLKIFDQDLYSLINLFLYLPTSSSTYFLDMVITMFESNLPHPTHCCIKGKCYFTAVDLELPLLVQQDNANQGYKAFPVVSNAEVPLCPIYQVSRCS